MSNRIFICPYCSNEMRYAYFDGWFGEGVYRCVECRAIALLSQLEYITYEVKDNVD